MKRLILIFGDQLNSSISSLRDFNYKYDIILMCEVMREASYIKHHKKKLAFIFSCMRHFALELKDNGYKVHYTKLDDKCNQHSFLLEVIEACKLYQCDKVVFTEPSEYRVLNEMLNLKEHQIDFEIREDDRFLCSINEFKAFFLEKKALLMETFYRNMRKKYNILMQDDRPYGGSWNYDKENRKTFNNFEDFVKMHNFSCDEITKEVILMVNLYFPDNMGNLEDFNFATTRVNALKALDFFMDKKLFYFGSFQDAMKEGDGILFHSYISFYLNIGLLKPLEVILLAQKQYLEGRASLFSVEGFIRQILGWREYIRGVYWLQMPKYKESNFFAANLKLPNFYWTGKTKMNCIKQCVEDTIKNSYAHHIQRLMVLGNFALLLGVNPREVHEWFLTVYSDAYEWVELPNVFGMALFADGGILATKPYAASGSYINKMSDYCKNCSYNVKLKNGKDACPFNYLYWNFLFVNKEKLAKNNRLAIAYNMLSKFDTQKIENNKTDVMQFLNLIY